MLILVLVLISLLLIFFFHTKETFQDTYQDPFNKYKIDTLKASDQRLLHFLGDSYDSIKSKPFTCDKNLSKKYEIDAVSFAFSEIDQKNCVEKANYICERTNPLFYLPESNFPARWTVKSLKDTMLPKEISLSCFNDVYNCCKSLK